MWRVIFYFFIIALIAGGAVWFAERPGALSLTWLGYEIETSLLFAAIVFAAIIVALRVVWSIIAAVFGLPGALTFFFKNRRQRRGYEALSKGMLAAGAGDAGLAQKFANQSGRWLANEPLTLMLKAQAAQLKGDEAAAERLFRSMVQMPDTELLGLHGLFIQARRRGDIAASKEFAERAFASNPALPWSARAVLMLQSAARDWRAAEQTLSLCRDSKLMTRAEADRKRAVILTARAMELEDNDDEAALSFALQAHKLAPELIPAAVVAGRILAGRGNALRASRVLAKTWRLSPHPDIAEIYGSVRSGVSPRERLKRIQALVKKDAGGAEGALALARAATSARVWRVARSALAPLLSEKLSARVCAAMADIEQGEFGDQGKTREWLARAVNAPRDPVWTADGFVSKTWLPISPVTGELDRFAWRVPLEALGDNVAEPIGLPGGELPAIETVVEEENSDQAALTPDPKPEKPDGEKDHETAQEAKTDNDGGSVDTTSVDVTSADQIAGDRSSGDQSSGDQKAADEALATTADKSDGPKIDDDDASDDPLDATAGEIFVPPPPDDPGPVPEKKEARGWLRSLFQ